MKKILLVLVFLFSFLVPVSVVGAQDFNPLEPSCTGQNSQASSSELCQDASDPEELLKGDESIFVKVANALALIGGIIAVVVIIIAGITMILSSGDSSKVKASRDTIIYTVIGLIVIVLSRSIVIFIINAVDN